MQFCLCGLTCDYACVCFPHLDGDLRPFRCLFLPLLAHIIKSSLPPLPPLCADSQRRSSSAPVCSCYAQPSVFLLLPLYFLSADSPPPPIPLLLYVSRAASECGSLHCSHHKFKASTDLYFPLRCMTRPLTARLRRSFTRD